MQTTLLALHAQTSIHAGTGQDDNVIDLPIQREAHTGYPCIFGSSMKGALRNKAKQKFPDRTINDGEQPQNTTDTNKTSNEKQQNPVVSALFGAPNNNGHAGALLIGDARLLLLPIRSLTGHFRWVTCPAILSRLQQDGSRFGCTFTFDVPAVDEEQALVASQQSDSLYLEEYRFSGQVNALDDIIKELSIFVQTDNATEMLKNQLAIVSNDNFAHLARHATPVNAHNVLNERKTSDNLWYEETLPPDTIMYVGVAADAVRKQEGMSASEVLIGFTDLFTDNPWLQVGGNETVGMGWFAVKVLNAQQVGAAA